MERRAVRSFVMRAGRMTDAQRRALEELWPRFGLAYGRRRSNSAALFGREAPCTLEIGFGNGEHLAARAQRRAGAEFPRRRGASPGHRPPAARRRPRPAWTTCAIIDHDAVEVLRDQIAPGRAR